MSPPKTQRAAGRRLEGEARNGIPTSIPRAAALAELEGAR